MEQKKYKYDYSLLRGRIKAVYGVEYKFAEALGVTATTLGRKFNEAGFTQTEIDKACYLLSIEPKDIHDYFFTKKVEKFST